MDLDVSCCAFGGQVGEPGLIEKSNAALLELTSKAQEMNLQIHFT